MVQYPFTTEELTQFANVVKDHLEQCLGLPELGNHAVVVRKRGLFGRLKSIWSDDKYGPDSLIIEIVTPSVLTKETNE